ncbi:MAG: DUF1850 domain-containing protein [Phascolarctobacterium sp.]|mgnify:CR=1 FL=1|nr:DUF1850 domain-containing protein [Phascolarctobacterium sp.]
MKRKSVLITVLLVMLAAGLFAWQQLSSRQYLIISDYETKTVYVKAPVKPGDRLFFGWVHSLEKIPWHEYYHITDKNTLMLETISFPAFGAGIPADRGKKVRVENGLIYMEEINQEFEQFDWINSHFATRDIKINDKLLTTGNNLPEHTRLILKITKGGF